MTYLAITPVLSACRELFGPEVELSPAFLSYLQPEGLKVAFRKRARETHPDLVTQSDAAPVDQAEPFRRVHAAYTTVNTFLSQRHLFASGRSRSWTTAPFRTATDPCDFRYQGELPQRHLQFGRFLFYQGVISYRTLLSALAWQRGCAPRLGILARQRGWLNNADICRIMTSSQPGPFGERAVRLGLLTPGQRNLLLSQQRSKQQRLGDYFVQQGLLKAEEVESLARQQRQHNARQRRP